MGPARKRDSATDDDVEQARMSFGDHLEELRRRLIRALIGVGAGMAACFYFAEDIVSFLCQPLILALERDGQSPRLYQEQVAQLFLNYMTVSLIAGLIVASPWVVYQIWKFVAAGLHRHERRFVKTYGPVSLGLFLAGAAFFYYLMLPFALKYFVEFNHSFKLPNRGLETPVQKFIYSEQGRAVAATQPEGLILGRLPVLADPPPRPAEGPEAAPSPVWIDARSGQVQYYYRGQIKAVAPMTGSLVQMWPNLAEYLGFTVLLMFVFGLSFQTPLVIMFLSRIGLVPAASLARRRRVVFLVIVILAAALTPTGDALSLFMLALPMYGLFELGLWLAKRSERARRNHTG